MNSQKATLATRQILLYLVDGLVTATEPFDRHGMYRKTIENYYDWREFDKKRFRDNLNRLQKEGFIKVFLKNNINQVELTNKGKDKVKLILAEDFKYQYPKKWDKKWRLIIFDIPNTKRKARDILRFRLKTLGCFPLQESVFVFPFDCKGVIDYIKNLYEIIPYVQYVIAESVETEVDLIRRFVDLGILKKKMIK
ncbi:hypothetical protein A2V71_01125 [Candidatus Berkelbacteria bacterium RBG_13_40_8]|uniref:Transcriptional repressor PaaX-like central Cas2-like domain-containing protein n=1 Tax=Candidatus Berkelbacteria bacterium RBG_13_40_8 TaxID=1797467 RepID=A0A1F5DP04_9BACT|nr:MAG: hypothetical protein A2V71_01125 [Candidatus Berkelbacteria bacterium RBG_13_40_8]